jgi:hypothetical protein
MFFVSKPKLLSPSQKTTGERLGVQSPLGTPLFCAKKVETTRSDRRTHETPCPVHFMFHILYCLTLEIRGIARCQFALVLAALQRFGKPWSAARQRIPPLPPGEYVGLSAARERWTGISRRTAR